jgi:hypothetical protein
MKVPAFGFGRAFGPSLESSNSAAGRYILWVLLSIAMVLAPT